MASGSLSPLETKVCSVLETRGWIEARTFVHSLPESPALQPKPKQEEGPILACYLLFIFLYLYWNYPTRNSIEIALATYPFGSGIRGFWKPCEPCARETK